MPAGPDADNFVSLLRPLRGPLERYARRMLRDPSLAEDVLQDSVIAALAAFDQFTPGSNFKAWMFRFVTHRVLNANRRMEPVSLHEIPGDLAVDDQWELPSREESFDLLVADPQRFARALEEPLASALGQLTAPERACLLLKSIGRFSYHEIHEMLEMPTGSVMGYLSRARRRLRVLLADYAAEYGWRVPTENTSGEKQVGGGEQP